MKRSVTVAAPHRREIFNVSFFFGRWVSYVLCYVCPKAKEQDAKIGVVTQQTWIFFLGGFSMDLQRINGFAPKTNPADKLGDHYADNAGPQQLAGKLCLKLSYKGMIGRRSCGKRHP